MDISLQSRVLRSRLERKFARKVVRRQNAWPSLFATVEPQVTGRHIYNVKQQPLRRQIA